MNLPTLPTENLYKFMALSGLVIVALCTAFPLQRIHDIELKLVEIDTETEMIDIDIQNIRDEIMDALATKGDLKPKEQALFRSYLEDLFKRKDYNELSKDWSKQEPILTIKEQATFRRRNNEIKKKITELKGKREKVVILAKEFKAYKLIIWIGGFFGITISFVGFWFWYILIQKPNDILLKKQIENNKN